jgi:hypothetical protein
MPRFRISADQALLNALRPSARGKWDTEVWLRIFQIIGMLVGASWIAYLYLTYQQESNILALETAQAQLQQAKLDYRKTKLDLRKTELDVAKSGIEVDRLGQTPLITTENLKVAPLREDPGAYFVSYDYTFNNPPGNPELTITEVMAEAFVARSEARVTRAGVLVNDVAEPGLLRWDCISRRGFRDPSRWARIGPQAPVVKGDETASPEYGGGGTGPMKGGEKIDGNITLLIRGRPTDLVGFRIRYTVNDGADPTHRRLLINFKPLGINTSGGTS